MTSAKGNQDRTTLNLVTLNQVVRVPNAAPHLESFLALRFTQLSVLRLLVYEMRLRLLPALSSQGNCKD